MRRLLILLLLLPLAASVSGSQPGRVDPVIRASPVALDPRDPARVRLGALRFLAGWVLKGRDSRFGGASSLMLQGDRFTAVSDAGAVFGFRLAGGRIVESSVADLAGGPARGRGKADRDVESMTAGGTPRHVWLGFEQVNEIWRFDAAIGHPERHVARAEMRGWPTNAGPEAMVRLRDGRFLVFSEEAPGPDGGSDALLFPGDPTLDRRPAIRFGYRPPEGTLPTDAAELPDGRVVLLNRHFSLLGGFSSVITLIDPAEIRAGKALVPVELARLAPPLTVDNMEGLAVGVEAGTTVLWLVSDDNFLPIERTLLLKFALDRLPARRPQSGGQ